MTIEDDEWRLDRGAHETLAGVSMCWARYVAPRRDWDHDHCEFCWQKFVDPTYPERFLVGDEAVNYREWLASTEDLMTEGYTNAEAVQGNEAGWYWVCPECFSDFTPLATWTLVDCPTGDRLRAPSGEPT
jgi:hypothetical protein